MRVQCDIAGLVHGFIQCDISVFCCERSSHFCPFHVAANADSEHFTASNPWTNALPHFGTVSGAITNSILRSGAAPNPFADVAGALHLLGQASEFEAELRSDASPDERTDWVSLGYAELESDDVPINAA